MKPRFTVLVVSGDGSRVVRFGLARSIVYGTLGLVAATAAAVLGLSGERLLLGRQVREMVALRQRADVQCALIDAFQTRVAKIRSEIMGWRMLHARMSEAFDLAAAPDQNRAGAGDADFDAGPRPRGAEPRPAGELDLLATTVTEEGSRLRGLEGVISRAGKIMSALPLHWPVRGQVKSGYGLRRSPWTGRPEHHYGIDIGSPPGTPVASPAAGTVVVASRQGGYGKEVMLDHGNGVRSRYGHLKKLDVQVGQTVEKGQVIGLVGSTGRSTGPHLHYEVLVEGKPVDPREFLVEH